MDDGEAVGAMAIYGGVKGDFAGGGFLFQGVSFKGCEDNVFW